jgi:hypothetical protein
MRTSTRLVLASLMSIVVIGAAPMATVSAAGKTPSISIPCCR